MPPLVRPHRCFTAAALAGTLLVARAADAQDTQYRVQIAAGLQATDNVLFTPMNGAASAVCNDGNPDNDLQNCPMFGFVGELNPQLQLTYETPRWLHGLGYNFALAWLIGAGDQVNYENRIEGRSRYDVSEVTTANFVVRFAHGQQTIFPQAQPGVPAAALVPGEFMYFNVEAQQGIAHAINEDSVFLEQLGVQVNRPIQDLGVQREGAQNPARPGIFNANLQLSYQHNDPRNNNEWALVFGSQLAAFDTYCNVPAECGNAEEFACIENRCVLLEDTLAAPRREELIAVTTSPQLLNRLAATLRHDWQNGFFTNIDLGVQHVMRVLDGGGQNAQPIGRLAIRYEREEANMELIYNHGAQINPAVAGIVMADNVDLIGNIPIDRRTRNFVLQLQPGYQRGSVIDEFGELLPGFNLFAGDVALEYRPQRYLPSATVNFRYQFRYQITEPQLARGEAEALHAMRNTFMINLGYEFPERAPAQ